MFLIIFLFYALSICAVAGTIMAVMNQKVEDSYWRGFHRGLQTNSNLMSKFSNHKVSVPLMITRDMRQQLHDLGYSKAEIDHLTPYEAQVILLEKA